jgi:HAD superfamily hydrolase (TIGR01509 family)
MLLSPSPATPQSATPQNRVRAVVFDLDGLMVDSEKLFVQVAERLLTRRGKQFSVELMRRMLGLRGPEGLALMRAEYQLEDTCESLAAESRDIFYEMMPHALEVMPGVFQLLERLESARLPKAVATSSTRSYTERVLAQFDLSCRFQFLLTAEDVTRGKPHPEIYHTAANRFGLAPSEIAVLEDSPVGLAAARAAGTRCFVVPSPYTPDANWSSADAVVPRLDADELFQLLGVADR